MNTVDPPGTKTYETEALIIGGGVTGVGLMRDMALRGIHCLLIDSKDLNARLRALGFTVYDPDMTMFTRAGGGVHCMAQPLRRDPV